MLTLNFTRSGGLLEGDKGLRFRGSGLGFGCFEGVRFADRFSPVDVFAEMRTDRVRI